MQLVEVKGFEVMFWLNVLIEIAVLVDNHTIAIISHIDALPPIIF